MRLIKLWVENYKNLVDTNIDFLSHDTPTAIIGNNGTGKSNLVEALFDIFISLYYGERLNFNFRLEYTAHSKHVAISQMENPEDSKIIVDGLEWTQERFRTIAQQPLLRPPFPAMIFGYYSGTCNRLQERFRRYNRTYSAKLRKQSDNFDRSFIFSDIAQADLILLALLAHGKLDLLAEIPIGGVHQLSITIQPPVQYRKNLDDPKFWGVNGVLLDFLADLDNVALESRSIVKEQVESEEASLEIQRTYILSQEQLEKIGYTSNSKKGADIFSMLQALKTRKILSSVNYTLKHIDGNTVFAYSELSEGEKQLISVIGGLWLTTHQECLVLLDEPDTHLNPAWTWKYQSLLKNSMGMSDEFQSTVLITTHNPILISGLKKEQILIAHNLHGALIYENPYRDPRGQGIANVLTSEFFGLPSSLDEYTQRLINERLVLAYKPGKLSEQESVKLAGINSELDDLGLAISLRDPNFKKFEESKYGVEAIE
jgi:ABC-type Mn2+/Zn2+ transport system ATPase subunit